MSQDIANDELADPSSLPRLLAWHTITDEELDEVTSSIFLKRESLKIFTPPPQF